MGNLPQAAERREFGRRKTNAHGMIIARGRPSVACVMRDASKGGALLEVTHPAWLPARFKLVVEANQFECEVVHRTHSAVGVRFATQSA